MRKINLLVPAALLILVSCVVVLAKVNSDNTSLPASAKPQILSVTGTTDAYMGPTRFPVFQNAVGDNPTCAAKLMKLYPDGSSFAPLPANYNPQKDYETVDGLVIENLAIPAANRATTKMQVSWTIRVEGDQPVVSDPNCRGSCKDASGKYVEPCPNPLATPGYRIFPCICPTGWHGTTDQFFKGGPANSRLYINGVAVGNIASMTVPDGITAHVVQKYDPTISGSFLITKDYFGGAFPDKISKLEIKWYNDTSMRIKSPANTRMIVVTVMPVTSTASQTN